MTCYWRRFWLLVNSFISKLGHKCTCYPFYCDFYFPKTDTFLEINGHWTHGGHFFDENNKTDIEKLNKWREKAKNSKFYANAIKTWTERDIKKCKYVKKNNLNMIVLWSKSDVLNFCEKNLKDFVL